MVWMANGICQHSQNLGVSLLVFCKLPFQVDGRYLLELSEISKFVQLVFQKEE